MRERPGSGQKGETGATQHVLHHTPIKNAFKCPLLTGFKERTLGLRVVKGHLSMIHEGWLSGKFGWGEERMCPGEDGSIMGQQRSMSHDRPNQVAASDVGQRYAVGKETE